MYSHLMRFYGGSNTTTVLYIQPAPSQLQVQHYTSPQYKCILTQHVQTSLLYSSTWQENTPMGGLSLHGPTPKGSLPQVTGLLYTRGCLFPYLLSSRLLPLQNILGCKTPHTSSHRGRTSLKGVLAPAYMHVFILPSQPFCSVQPLRSIQTGPWKP